MLKQARDPREDPDGRPVCSERQQDPRDRRSFTSAMEAHQRDTACRCVIQDGFAPVEWVDRAKELLRSEALHHQGRCGAIRDPVGQGNEDLGRHQANIAVRPLRTQ